MLTIVFFSLISSVFSLYLENTSALINFFYTLQWPSYNAEDIHVYALNTFQRSSYLSQQFLQHAILLKRTLAWRCCRTEKKRLKLNSTQMWYVFELLPQGRYQICSLSSLALPSALELLRMYNNFVHAGILDISTNLALKPQIREICLRFMTKSVSIRQFLWLQPDY